MAFLGLGPLGLGPLDRRRASVPRVPDRRRSERVEQAFRAEVVELHRRLRAIDLRIEAETAAKRIRRRP